MENAEVNGIADLAVGATTTPEVVVVRVGPSLREYTLPKELLIQRSGRFRQLLTGYPYPPTVAHITLAHTSIETFDVFVGWLYEQKLPAIAHIGSCWILSESYILADFLSVNDMKTALIQMIFSILYFTHSFLDTSGVCRLFTALPEGDPLLQLVVDAFCINEGIRSMDAVDFARIEDLPKEYLVQVMRKLHRLSHLPAEQRNLRRADYV